MKTTPLPPVNYTAILRVADAPALHEELTRRMGPPETCFDEPAAKRGALWTMESPFSRSAGITETLSWASALVGKHAEFLRGLVASGTNISLHLACDAESDFVLLDFDPALFKPFIAAGIRVEFYFACDPSRRS